MEIMLGFQREADGKNGHKEDNRFSVRCNFAVQQNCVKADVRAQGWRGKGKKQRAAMTGKTRFETSKRAADGKCVMSFKSRSSVRHSLEK